jgi:hydrogenase small subunit
MILTRRSFLRYCNVAAAAIGLDALHLATLNQALANPAAPTVIWLHGSSCTGCSVSFLNRISDKAGEPATVADVLASAINLTYHATIMAATGDTAAAAIQRAKETGNFILVVEGAVPMAFKGRCCIVYSYNGVEVTFMQAVQELSAVALKTVCVGTCASFGGIPASGSNPTQAVSVGRLTGRPVINISGCPANPDWVVWAIVQLLTGQTVTLDGDGRPVALYSTSHSGTAEFPLIHDKCPRNPTNTGTEIATQFGQNGLCLQNLGCRGPFTKSRCNKSWNGIGAHVYPAASPGHWCIGVNAPCHGCVERTFPGPQSFYEPYQA